VNCNEGLASGDVMVRVGSVCIDRYEASIWTARTGGTQITGEIPCNANGQNCDNIFARSVAGVVPRADITWLQAQQALANSGKQLPSNAEWQMAVAGTPDGGPCNVISRSIRNTGANDACKSAHGANDMVGNLSEWVGDWVPRRTCSASWGTFSDDSQGICGAAMTGAPGALIRGGDFDNGPFAGPLAVAAGSAPSDSNSVTGFRGAR
jgi:formylglycine-generating enzyme required for sulfatase activity